MAHGVPLSEISSQQPYVEAIERRTFREQGARALAALALVSSALVSAENVDTPVASASNTITYETFGYPYWDEPYDHSPYTRPEPAPGPANYCLNYDWGPTPDTTPGWTESDSYDPATGYGYENCTDYVAWQLAQYGVPSKYYTGLGYAYEWEENAQAKGIPTGSTPEDDAVAVAPSTSGDPDGHVAIVDSVNNDGTITVSEYNYDEAGDGDIQTGTASSMGFTGYVYFEGLMTNPPVGSSPAPNGGDLALNSDFGNGTQNWATSPGSNFTTYDSNQLGPESYYASYSGVQYAATNTDTANGGFYQDIPLAIQPNETFCATAEVRTDGGGSGAWGELTLFQLGGSYTDSESVSFGNLTDNWQQVEDCSVATTSHDDIRVQFYPGVHSPTVDVDDVVVDQTLDTNADFGNGTNSWTPVPGSNFTTYSQNQLGTEPYDQPYSGVQFAATNTSTPLGGIYQDIPMTTTGNETICATAEVRTDGGGSGAYGAMAIFQLGGSYTDGESVNFGPLSDNWQQIEDCSVATTSHTDVRVEFYPGENAPTLDIDDVNVQESLGLNTDFGSGSEVWQTAPGSNFTTYDSNQLGPEPYYASYSGVQYAATNTDTANGGFYQDVSIDTTPNQTFCATAEVRTDGGLSGAYGAMEIFQLNGAYNDGESVTFGPLGDNWQQIEDCSVATTSHTDVRVEFYPGVNAPTLDVDDVDVQ